MLQTTAGKAPPSPLFHNWQNVAARFTRDRDCLASFIAYETAEVLDGIKPGNLVNVTNRDKPCGRNPYRLWKAHGEALLSGTGLRVEVLCDRGSSLTAFFYRRDLLRRTLESKESRAFLHRVGYPPFDTPEEAIGELKARMKRDRFPHEVGLFLGYPLKDVEGFLGWSPLPFTCQGPWKIYGDPRQSLRLAERHRACRCRMAEKLSITSEPLTCLRQRGEEGFGGCGESLTLRGRGTMSVGRRGVERSNR